MIVPTYSEELKMLLNELEGTKLQNITQEKFLPLFQRACVAHKKLTSQMQHSYYLHLSLFLANELSLNGQTSHPIVDSESYSEMYKHDLITSNLGDFPGVEYVYSGHPPDKDMYVVGYIIQPRSIFFTITSMIPQPRLIQTVMDTFHRVLQLLSCGM